MPAAPHIFSVREITRYVKTVLEHERALQGMLVRGEISNCKYHSSGHLYFTLKDDTSQLPCVMWRDRVREQQFRCEDGMRIVAEGSVTVYERGGQYQLSVYDMQADGVGNLYLAFEQLKRKLEGEGLFDQERKRPLPAIPRRVALLSSPTGAVVHDVVTVASRRWKGRRIILIPTAVQGPQAPASIVRSLRIAARLQQVDVIILARGGGSFEELSCFNDEAVARAIADSPVPVVSAVGHETDFTIADFVADLRAPTPSAAAELVFPDVRGIEEYVDSLGRRILDRLHTRIEMRKRDLQYASSHPAMRNPRALLQERAQTLDLLDERILARTQARLEAANARFQAVEGRIAALDPRGVLLRGYALVTDPASGALVPSRAEAAALSALQVQFFDGTLSVIPAAQAD